MNDNIKTQTFIKKANMIHGDKYINTLQKQLFIENQGYNLITIWEDEWDVFIKNNKIESLSICLS